MLALRVCLSWNGDPEACRFGAGLNPGPHVELPKDRRDVVVDRPRRDDESLGYLGVPQSFGYELQHLQLAGRQPCRVALGRGSRPARHIADPLLTESTRHRGR